MYNNYLRNALVSIVTARQALQSYESTKIRNVKSVAAYHTQQSVEYVLKYLIYKFHSEQVLFVQASVVQVVINLHVRMETW